MRSLSGGYMERVVRVQFTRLSECRKIGFSCQCLESANRLADNLFSGRCARPKNVLKVSLRAGARIRINSKQIRIAFTDGISQHALVITSSVLRPSRRRHTTTINEANRLHDRNQRSIVARSKPDGPEPLNGDLWRHAGLANLAKKCWNFPGYGRVRKSATRLSIPGQWPNE
jgi:hypothetical protein